NNTWGYDVGAASVVLEDFKAIPLPDGPPDTINSSSTPIEDDKTIVTFGAKADMTQKVGVYSQIITFTAVTNPVPPPTVVSVAVDPAAPGDTITITGTNFYAGGASSGVLRVTIGGGNSGTAAMSCINRTVTSNTSLTCEVPNLEPGTYPIVITTFGGSSNSDVEIEIIHPLIPPPGAIPGNISTSNPAVLDVYPTTGWEGDVITITSNALFTSVTSVTIGGTPCAPYQRVSTSVILCRLPAKSNGTSNAIEVTNNSTNITDASTYTHMKITYFDPTASTVTLNGYTYNYYPNGFTGTDCSGMTPSNATNFNPINPGPNPSIVYVRDTRNNQVYKVKRMIDNKCWMIDNLKYVDVNISNVDGTSGTIFRNGSGPNVPSSGTGTYNTLNGTATQSAANSNKAFYNNPMSGADCYGGSSNNMASNTTTHCGYLYNWYAATGGTGSAAMSTRGNQALGNICLANFRLPSSYSGTGGPTTDGTSTSVADFTVLNASMNAGSLTTGSTSASYYNSWRPIGPWFGTVSGYWFSGGLAYQNRNGAAWSSTVFSAANVYHLLTDNTAGAPYAWPAYNRDVLYGHSVRCLIETPIP
ncbi:IPT/TIG domain-containing protein, partial [Candidatus Saccharibacteria bacterium]|nr:IPT/TIG domain-containing protein [Candidatus Saccharibacteria bacterium]